MLPPIPRWRSLGLVALGALLTLLLVAGASAASGLFAGPETETLEAPAYSFEHPAEWQRIEGVSFPLAEAAGREDVGEHTIGIDPDNYVTVFAGDSGIQIDEGNVEQYVAQARPFWAAVAKRTGSKLLAAPYRVNEAGLPGMRTRMEIMSARGVRVEDEVTMLFRDETNYVFTCQSRPDRATEMTAGCGKVLETFRGKAAPR